MFRKEVYQSRRKTLLQKMSSEKGIILFLGNIDSPAQYKDNCYKWRQDSSWLYFFGIDEPRFAATIDLESGEEVIYADDFTLDDILWMGPMPTVASQAAAVGVDKTAPYAAVADALKGRQVHFLPTSRYANMITLGNLLGVDPLQTTSAGKKGCALASRALVDAVISLRLIKGKEEIAAIDHACNIGYQMHTAARKAIKTGIVEQEIVGAMEGVTLAKGWGVSFNTILTQHGEIFHCHSHDCLVEPGRLLLVDAGAESNDHYASDFTRVYPTTGKFTTQQREIYQIVYEANELGQKLAVPGTQYRDVHIAVGKHILKGLSELNLIKGDIEEMSAAGVAGLFMPHGLGHNMGIDVHDMEDLGEDLVGYEAGQSRSSQLGLGSLRMARTLQEGHVITVEPGIYFIPDLIAQWERDGVGKDYVQYQNLKPYFNFGGIRLEDDVLITSEGNRRLGDNRLPIAPDDVEIAMKED